jgi:hypothetical protein
MPGSKAAPTLPDNTKQQKKKAASSTALPISHAQFITLEDGTQVGRARVGGRRTSQCAQGCAAGAHLASRYRQSPTRAPALGAAPAHPPAHVKRTPLTQVPVKIPPGMPAAQAQGILEFLKANPDAAKAAWAQAQSIMATPALANAFVNMQSQQVRCAVVCCAAAGGWGVAAHALCLRD